MRTLKVGMFVFLLVGVLFGLAMPVQAQPPIPSSFYGQIHLLDGAPSAGDTLEAYIPGVSGPAASSVVKSDTGALVYSINIPGDIEETQFIKEGGVEGDLVTFKIAGRTVASGVWHLGTNVHLNLHPPKALPGGPYSGVVDSAISFSATAEDWGSDASIYAWDWNNDGTYEETAQSLNHTWTMVGNYTIGLKVADAQKGEGFATFTVTIGKATATITLSGKAAIYDGTAKTVTAVTSPAGKTVDITYDGSPSAPTNAKSYAVVATINDPNYIGTVSDTLVITKASSTTTVTGGTFVYDGAAHAATVAVTGAGGLNLAPAPVYSGSCLVAPVNVAQTTACTASYTYAGDANHDGSSNSAAITITKAPATITLGGLDATYDGTAKSVTTITSPSGRAVTVTYAGSTTPPTAAGSYAVVATINDPNYSGTTGGTLVINKASASVVLSNLSVVYDGTAKPVGVTVTPSGLSVNITYGGETTQKINAGSYAVVATVTDANYTGSASGTLIIAKASSTTLVTGGSFTYNNTPRPGSVSVTGAGGLSISTLPTSYTGSCLAAPVNVTQTPCTAGYVYAGDINHDGSSGSAVITITPAAASVALSGLSQVYDGTAKHVTVTTTPAGLTYTITYNGSTSEPIVAGSYAVIATITDPNYTGSVADTLVIAAYHSLTLTTGWNMVSFSLHPTDTRIEKVLEGISGKYDLVYAWDASGSHSTSGNWVKFDDVPGSPDSLTNLDETMGFWIHITSANSVTLNVTGSVPISTNVALSTAAGGWNLVGYASGQNRTLPAALESNGVGIDYSLIYAYHANETADPWKLYDRIGAPYANDLTNMAPGWGYWIKVTAAHTWAIDY